MLIVSRHMRKLLLATLLATGMGASAAMAQSPGFQNFQSQYAEQSVVAPAMGLDAPKSPNVFQRMGSSIASGASSVGGGIKSMWRRATSAFTRGSDPSDDFSANDPTSLSSEMKEPSAQFYVSLARMQEQTRNEAGAIEHYKKALDAEPQNTEALLGLARLHDRAGRLAEAEPLYQQAVQTQQGVSDASAWNDLGLCQARQQNLPAAASSLESAVTLAPEESRYRNNLAIVLVEEGNVEAALKQMKAVHPAAVAHYNVGYLLNKRGQPDVALQQFHLALQADPTLVAAQQWIESLSAETIASTRSQETRHDASLGGTQQVNSAEQPPAGPSLGPQLRSGASLKAGLPTQQLAARPTSTTQAAAPGAQAHASGATQQSTATRAEQQYYPPSRY